jgi:putative tricarboxylic transport membrane protein
MAGGAALAALPVAARAADPLPNLNLFVPGAAGGGWDQTARSIERTAKHLRLVNAIGVTNFEDRAGGLVKFAHEYVFRDDWILVAGLVMISATAAAKSPLGLVDLTPIARLAADFQVVAVPASSRLQSATDLAAALAADVQSLVWTGGSAGGTDHILAGLIGRAAGVDLALLKYVPAAAGLPIQAALLDGRAAVGIGGWRDFANDIASGALRPLGISSRSRRPGINIPTLKEQGVDVELVNWRGVFAPPKLHETSLKTLGATFESMGKSLAWHDELTRRGWLDLYQPSEPFGRFVANETNRIGDVLRRLGAAG